MFSKICSHISICIICGHSKWFHIVMFCFYNTISQFAMLQLPECMVPVSTWLQNESSPIEKLQILKKWQDTLYEDRHSCIPACESNVTCLTSQGENVWVLLNIHCKRPWKHIIEHIEYILILMFLTLIYNWCGNILVIYTHICLLIAIDDLRHNLH